VAVSYGVLPHNVDAAQAMKTKAQVHDVASDNRVYNWSIGDEAAIGDCVQIYNLGRVRIGAQATISQGVHLCAGTHDHRRPDLPLVKCTITIGQGAWVCADAFVGPNVNVGDFAILGARAVVVRDVGQSLVVAGNPARIVGRREWSTE
jgi:putative colanic acid biosynthesis acetyltransferase WcaF